MLYLKIENDEFHEGKRAYDRKYKRAYFTLYM